MLVSDDKPTHVQAAKHYRQYRQQIAKKGEKPCHILNSADDIIDVGTLSSPSESCSLEKVPSRR
jgi:hypothetical protein